MAEDRPMTPEQWLKIKTLVGKALDLEPEERDSFLRQECADDEFLRRQVEEFLVVDSHVSNFLESPAYKALGSNGFTTEQVLPDQESEDILPIGESFLDKYQILKLIGKGGMGYVYLAKHIELGVYVAIKVLHTVSERDYDSIDRFKREARTAASLEHPNIVRVFDYGVKDGLCYLIMEYLEGESLRTRLNRSGRMPFSEVVYFAEQVSNALGFIHRKGIVHRDLKPDNIFFHRQSESEIVKILDFGIAKSSSSTQGVTLTQSGAIFGTPHYMSPEQCQGKTLDSRSDIYSFGVILYEMLSGRKPFNSDSSIGFMYLHVHEPAEKLHKICPEIPVKISEVVSKILAKRREDRYNSAEDVAKALKHSTNRDSETITAKQVDSLAITKPLLPIKKIFSRSSIIVLVFLAIIATTLTAIWNRRSVTEQVDKKERKIEQKKVTTNPAESEYILIEPKIVNIGSREDGCSDTPDCKVSADEMPLHVEKLDPYYIGKYEVTNSQYREFIAATGYRSPVNWIAGDYLEGMKDLPVTGVSWYDAVAYCRWRSDKESIDYRLPTEFEWEYAANGGDARIFVWGNKWSSSMAFADKKGVTAPLPINISPNNTTDKSPFGIFAMAGNVREWTSSSFSVYPGSSYKPKKLDLECKVIRGGAFDVVPSGTRVTFRAWKLPAEVDVDLGFRLAVSKND